jgi:hypothetical protein
MILLKVEASKIDKYRRHCLWRGRDINSKKTSFSCLKNGNKAKMKGGIGVIKLRVQNDALLLKNLHMFFNKADLPWVHLI